MPDRTPTDDLSLTALRYAARELTPAEAAAFEDRLATDQAARESLGEAIRLSAAALHQPAPAPDPLVREAVRDALRPALLSRLFPRRPYRGHPLAWAVLGGAVAAGLTALGVWLGDRPGEQFRQPDTADVTPRRSPEPETLTVPPVRHVAATNPAGSGQVARAPAPRPVADDDPDDAVTEPPAADRRAVATDADDAHPVPDRIPPARSMDGKSALQPDPGAK